MEIFNFEKEDITRHIEYELRTTDKFREPMNFIIKSLTNRGCARVITSLDKIDFDNVREDEGKNYHWSVFVYENVTLAVRRYSQHLIVYTRVINEKKKSIFGESNAEYGAFTLYTDMEKFGDRHDEMLDQYWTKPFTDLEAIFKNLMEVLKDRGVHWVWNSATLKRPKHVEIKLGFDGKSISSIDDFVICMEEASRKYLELFSETVMLKRLKELKTGDRLGEPGHYKIGKIATAVKDDYYHDAGMEFITGNGKNKSFNDVYSLTRYYFKEVFGDMLYFHDGDAYVKGGKLKDGCPAAYAKEDDREVTVYSDKYPKENFVPLKKY